MPATAATAAAAAAAWPRSNFTAVYGSTARKGRPKFSTHSLIVHSNLQGNIPHCHVSSGWLGSRVVSVLDSGAECPRVQIAVATLSGNSLRQTVHTHCASVYQAAKLVAALLRVAGVTAGLAESNGSLPPGL